MYILQPTMYVLPLLYCLVEPFVNKDFTEEHTMKDSSQ